MINQKQLLEYCREYALPVSDKTVATLDHFADLLTERNRVVNLTAIKDADGIAVKHLLDSLLIFKYIDFPTGASVIDVGCGAGFPSLPMLIARGDLKITFLDSTGKKLQFVDDCLRELGLHGNILHARAEEEAKKNVSRETFDFAVARAVANLASLAELTLPFVKQGGYFIAMKGKEGKEELELAQNAIQLMGGAIQTVHTFCLPDGSARTILVIKKLSQTPTKYPRTATAILKKPL